MNKDSVRRLLEEVGKGTVKVDDALAQLSKLPYEDLGFAKIDHHRALRKGFPEVVYGQGKTPDQIEKIVEVLAKEGSTVLVTRTGKEAYDRIKEDYDSTSFHNASGVILINPPEAPTLKGDVVVMSAGTSDRPVTEEATLTARAMGCKVTTIQDVGVAGIHRMLDHAELLENASVVIVVAGMDGALPSAVAGLISTPVVAVPTSAGYGASFGGLSALLAMLNSCGSGVTVVNIDNGFGAGYFAGLLLKKQQ